MKACMPFRRRVPLGVLLLPPPLGVQESVTVVCDRLLGSTALLYVHAGSASPETFIRCIPTGEMFDRSEKIELTAHPESRESNSTDYAALRTGISVCDN